MAVFTDDFNRANGALGADWTITAANPSVDTNRCYIPATTGLILQNNIVLGLDQYTQCKITQHATGPKSLAVRAWNPGPGTRMSGYGLEFLNGSVELYRYDVWNGSNLSGAPSRNLLDSWGGAFVNGDILRLEVLGTSLIGYVNGTPVVSALDAVISTAESAGFLISFSGTAGFIDDFETGDWSVASGGGASPFRKGGSEGIWNRGIGHP